MKKFFAIFLLVALSISACACDVKDETAEESTSTSPAEISDIPSLDAEEVFDYVDEKLILYKDALKYLEEGNLEASYDTFLSIKGYRDVDDYLDRFSFQPSAVITRSPLYVESVYFEYDKYGKQTLELYYSTYGTMYSYSYEYDDNENLMIKQVYRRGVREEITMYEYDENKRPVCQINPGGFFTKLEYDANGNIIKSIDSSEQCNAYTYDADGNCLSREYSLNGVLLFRISYEYDPYGNCIRELQEYDLDTEIHSSTVTTFEYDENGNMIKETREQSNGINSYTEYEYDENGNKIKEAYYYMGSVSSIYSWQYDENGNMIKEQYETEKGKYSTELYEYDPAGNCVKHTYISHKSNFTSIVTFEYDDYGNLLKRESPGDTDSPNDYYITAYTGYKLYYNPYTVSKLPEQLDGKG